MREPAELPTTEAEVVELGPVTPSGGGRTRWALFAATVVVLVALIGLAGMPASRPGVLTNPGEASRPPRPSVTVNSASPNSASTLPWTWKALELRGYGRGSTVENLWVVADRFVAEVESDEGPDGGPSGPFSSVLLVSSDGLEWTRVQLPAVGFVIAAGTVASGRLWVVGHVLTGDAPRWQLWSAGDREWRHEADPEGLVEGEGTVTALAYRSECKADGDCRAVGWVAATRSSRFARPADVRVSDDGRTWTSAALPDQAPMSVFGIVEHGGLWVVGAGRLRDDRDAGVVVALTSTDRHDWSSTVVARDGAQGRGMAAGIDGVVMVGAHRVGDELVPRAWTSMDGGEWLTIQPNIARGRTPTSMDVVAATEHGHVALSGTTGDAWIALDQELWLHRAAFDAGAADAVRAVAAAGDILVAAGRSTAGRPAFWVGSLSLQLPSR